MSIFSVATSAVMLLMLGSFLVMVASLNVTLRALEQKVNVVAYLKDGADPAAVQTLHDSLLEDARVASVTLVTKQQALVRMQQTLGSQSKLLAQLGDNPLPASFEIALKSAGSAPQIAQLVQGDPAVES
ncbi:MAG: cell division protein FtsX, partial [Chloroflexota bacterium]